MLQFARYDGVRARTLRMLSGKPELFARSLAIHVGWTTTKDVVATGAQLGWQFLIG